jgi:hypothetical protein
MTIGIFKEWLVKYFFVHKVVFKAKLVGERLSHDHLIVVFKTKVSNFSAISRQEQVTFDEMTLMSALY